MSKPTVAVVGATGQVGGVMLRVLEEREFLRLTRELVIVGYFTSEKIGKTLLRYDPVPGRYDADIPPENGFVVRRRSGPV